MPCPVPYRVFIALLALVWLPAVQADPAVLASLEDLNLEARRLASFSKADCSVARKHQDTAGARLSELSALERGFPAPEPDPPEVAARNQAGAARVAADAAFLVARVATDSVRNACRAALEAVDAGDAAAALVERAARAPATVRRSLTDIENHQVAIMLARHRLGRLAEGAGGGIDIPTAPLVLQAEALSAAERAVAAVVSPLTKSEATRLEGELRQREADRLLEQARGSADPDRIAIIETAMADTRAAFEVATQCQAQVSGRQPAIAAEVEAAAARLGPDLPERDEAGVLQVSVPAALRGPLTAIDAAAGRAALAALHTAGLLDKAGNCQRLAEAGPGRAPALQGEAERVVADLHMPAQPPARVPEPGNFGQCEPLYSFWRLKTGCRFDEALEVLRTQTSGAACADFADYIQAELANVQSLHRQSLLVDRLLIEAGEMLELGEAGQALEQFIAARGFARCQTRQQAGNAGIARALEAR